MGARQVVFLGLLAIVGCGGGAAVDRTPIDSCDTRTPAYPTDTVTVVLFGHVDLANAPWGRNREERFVFRHLYETLLTVDCRGAVQPALAKSILPASDGWLIELREDARFWDETRVTAYDAANVIERAITQGIAITSVDVIDERSMIIHGDHERPDLRPLSHQMFAVAKHSATGGVPIGSGSWMLDEGIPVAEAIAICPVTGERPVVRFVQGNASDARDIILERTADAIITDAPPAIEYAREKEHVALIPLAWDRAYVFLSRTRAGAVSLARQADPNASPLPDLPSSLQNALARDAVRVDARGGGVLLKVAEARTVPVSMSEAFNSTGAVPAVVYEAGDETARGLAERIVALGAMDTCSVEAVTLAEAVPGLNRSIRAKGLDPVAFREALASGQFFGYVVPLSWDADYPVITSHLLEGARWISSPTLRPLDSFVALVETRAHFIAISDRVGYINDHNGGVRILGPTAVNVP